MIHKGKARNSLVFFVVKIATTIIYIFRKKMQTLNTEVVMKDSFGLGLVMGMIAGVVLIKACKPADKLADKAEQAIKSKLKTNN